MSNSFWQDYDGTGEGQDFWEDQDMWRAMREADEVAIAAEEDVVEMTCDNCWSVIKGPNEHGDYYDTAGNPQCSDGNWHDPGEPDEPEEPSDADLLNNIDLALETFRPAGHYSTVGTTAGGNCRGCGQRHGHSIFCPVVNPNTTHVSSSTLARRDDAIVAFQRKDYKAEAKKWRGGKDAHKGTKPTAVLVDMDGTIDDAGSPNAFGMAYVRKMHNAGHLIVIGTARTHEYEYERSHKWLVRELSHKYSIPFVGPFCRAKDDRRFACHFKAGLIDTLSNVYDFVGAIDDDKWCLAELRRLKTLEVVEAKPAPFQEQLWRRSSRYSKPRKPRYYKGD